MQLELFYASMFMAAQTSARSPLLEVKRDLMRAWFWFETMRGL
jgi:hypothetical protein